MWEGGVNGEASVEVAWEGGGRQEVGKARGEDAVSDETGVDDTGRRRLKEDEEAGVRGIQHRHDKIEEAERDDRRKGMRYLLEEA